MRASSAVLLATIVVVGQGFTLGKHNDHIAQHLNDYDNDEHIILAKISQPDVVINKHVLTDPDAIAQTLKAHVADAAEKFRLLSDSDKAEQTIDLPDAIHSSQLKAMKANANTLKRSAEPKIDLAATAELYKQALDFLDKYDVQLRYD